MGALFGTIGALCIGLSDLFGRRIMAVASPLTVAIVLQFSGGMVSVVALLIVPSQFNADDMVRALISGLGLGVGLGCYYNGVDRSTSTIVAPLVATLSAVIPFGYVVLSTGQGTALGVVSAGLAFIGLAMVSSGAAEVSNVAAGLAWGTTSGLGYGIGIAIVTDIASDSGVWPALGQRLSAFTLLASLAAARRMPLIPPATTRSDVAFGGLFVAITTISLLVGVGFNAGAAVVTLSLFPIFSVAIGRVFFADSVRPVQLVGIAISLAGVAGVVAT